MLERFLLAITATLSFCVFYYLGEPSRESSFFGDNMPDFYNAISTPVFFE